MDRRVVGSSSKSRGIAAAAAVAAALLGAACGSSPDPDDDIRLADGFQVLFRTEGPAFRVVANTAAGHIVTGEMISAVDASTTPERIVIAGLYSSSTTAHTWHANPTDSFDVDYGLAGGESGRHLLFVSEDGGAGWETRPVRARNPDAWIVPYQFGVAEHEGRAVVHMPHHVSSGDSDTVWRLSPIDLETGVFEDPVDGDTMRNVWVQNGPILSWSGMPDGANPYFLIRYDIRTGERRHGFLDGQYEPGAPGSCVTQYARPVGETRYYSVCAHRDAAGQMVSCVLGVDTSLTVEEPDGSLSGLRGELLGCTPFDESDLGPIGGVIRSRQRAHHLLRHGSSLMQAYEAEGHVWLAGRNVYTGAVEPAIDLGPGELLPVEAPGLHPRYPGIVAIQPPDGGTRRTRYVMIPESYDPPVELELPSPCTDGCEADPLLIHRVGDGRLMLVYTLGREHAYLVVGFMDDPLYVPPPTPEEPTIPRASALEARCLMEAWCTGRADEAFSQACIDRWLTADAAAFARFLATPLECDALRAVDASMNNVAALCGEVPERCDGDRAYRCVQTTTSEVPRWLDCAALNGGTCRLDAGGRPSCLTEGAACPGPAHCDAEGRAVDCEQGVVHDCAALGGRCVMTYGATPRPVCELLESNDCYLEDHDPESAVEQDRPLCPDPLGADTSGYDCFGGRAVRRFDCARLSLSCLDLTAPEPIHADPAPPEWSFSGPSWNRCFSYDSAGECPEGAYYPTGARCEGDELVFCTMGVGRAFDCGSVGMRCREARCAP